MASAARRETTRRELLLVALAAVVLSVVMNWPLVLHLGETIPKDLGDPLPQSWQIAWGGHALAHQPLDFFQANTFWPAADSLAFGDALIGYAPSGLIGSGPEDAVARYDLAFLFAYALAFFGAYLLARELGLGRAGAAVAGAAYAYAPFRLEQDGHMQVISSGGIPLALALAVRGVRRASRGWIVAAWLVAAWQVSLGFAIGLPFIYLIALLIGIAAVVWLRRGRPPLDRRLLAAAAVGAALFMVIVAVIARPYFRVADEYAEATRPPSTVEAYSGPLRVFVTAPDENLVWGAATETFRDGLEALPEKTLWPGVLFLALAAVGLGSSAFPRWLRYGLGAGVLFVWILALGFQEEGGLLWPYRWLYEFLPGWEGIRTPGRVQTFSSLGIALLAAAGAQSLLAAARSRLAERSGEPGAPGGPEPRRVRLAVGAMAALLVLALLVEGRGLPFDPTDRRDQPEVDTPPSSVADVPAPQLHLPAERAEDNRRYTLWSTDGFPSIVNGRASTEPDATEELIGEMRRFPDAATVERLREFGVRSVILHTDRAAGTPQALAAAAPIEGLGLSVERRGPLLIYGLDSPSTAPGRTAASG
ncbi:MAG TPA: hypothetical protein VHH72_11350 [Solirubrobacterales bacterium]|jgi:hypothetical protein|nr:hypothetical protein [Solirubrobacterales bacterium]